MRCSATCGQPPGCHARRIVCPALGCLLATFNVELVEDALWNRIWRAVIRAWVVVVIQPDCGDCPLPHVRAPPASTAADELAADTEIRMFHRRTIARPLLNH